MPRGYPLNLILEGRKCLVVGEGDEAELRACNLREAGAHVSVVTAETFHEGHLDDTWLVVQTSQAPALAQQLATLCEARRIFFCAVDQPQCSSYSHLALTRAGSLTLAIGTEGRAPALSRRLREELSRLLDQANATEEVENLASLRDTTAAADRREILNRAVSDVHFTGKLRFHRD